MTRRSHPDSGWPRRSRRVILILLVAYAVLLLMLSLLQRALIYMPTREPSIRPEAAGFAPGQIHTLQLRVEDDVELRGWHVLAEGDSPASHTAGELELQFGRRLVLYFCGNGGNRRYRVDEIQILTSLGCDVFIFDYRGYGDSSGTPSEQRLAEDAQAIWNYVTAERQVPPQQIVLYGESLGGAVAVRLASSLSQSGTPPGGLILRSTFSSLVDAGQYHYPWLPVGLVLVDRFDSVKHISQVSCPILQLHGSRDSIVPLELGQRLFAAAPEESSTRQPKQFVELRSADHNDVTMIATAELRTAIQLFLDRLPQSP